MARIKQNDVDTTNANVGNVNVCHFPLLFIFCLLIGYQWMAPECLTHKQYSEASDAFSYGMLNWLTTYMHTMSTPNLSC